MEKLNIAVGLSGGVDSSVSALLLKEQGHHVTGITMKLWRGQYKGGTRGGCFGEGEEKNIEMASSFAKSIGIDYKVYDVSEEYDKTIISYFRETYLSGKTPNPCVRCNQLMKFGLLPRLAKESGLNFDKFATGHYARIEKRGDRYALLRAKDESKDQSYFLYRLSQEQLARHIFPMGNMLKEDIRKIARDCNLIAADRPDSQDFYSGDKSELIGEEPRPGEIVDSFGKVLGTHNGFWRYTIGQRKGLGIGGAGEPYYVIDLNACRNQVVVGRADDAVKTELTVEDMVWGSISPTDEEIECRVKVRSAGCPRGPAVLKGNHCIFPNGIAGIAPGQSAVFYAASSDEIIAGGIIV